MKWNHLIKLLLFISPFVSVGQSVTFRCGNNKVEIYASDNPKSNKSKGFIDRMFFTEKEMTLTANDYAGKKDTIKWELLYIYYNSKQIPLYESVKAGRKITIDNLHRKLFQSEGTKIILTLTIPSKKSIIVVTEVLDKDSKLIKKPLMKEI